MLSARGRLLHFHKTHFSGQTLPPLSNPTLGFDSEGVPDDVEDNAQDDHMLGHYEDGVRRTLTDEQIAIFRHTEIQQLLRERRQKSEALAGPGAGSNPDGQRIDCKGLIVEQGELSSKPLNGHEKEEYEVKKDGPPPDMTRSNFGGLSHILEQQQPGLSHVERSPDEVSSTQRVHRREDFESPTNVKKLC